MEAIVWSERLTEAFSNHGTLIFTGDRMLCLSTRGLGLVQSALQKKVSGVVSTKCNFEELSDNIGKVIALKIVNDTRSIWKGCLHLSMFKALTTLEIERIPIETLKGLETLRDQLKRMTVKKSLNNIEDLIVSCCGDNSTPSQWTTLTELFLSQNSIATLGSALKYLPNLKKLDLSHNCLGADSIKDFSYLNTVEELNLSCNRFQRPPELCHLAQMSIRNLNLRSNDLDNLCGLEKMIHLEVLDIQDNCISDSLALQSLQYLCTLREIKLKGNPLYFHTNYRQMVINCVSTLIDPFTFYLDGTSLSSRERKLLSKRPSTAYAYKESVLSQRRSDLRGHSVNLSADEISVSEFEDSGRGFFTDPSILKQHKKSRPKRARKINFEELTPKPASLPVGIESRPEIKEYQDLRRVLNEKWLESTQMEVNESEPTVLKPSSPESEIDGKSIHDTSTEDPEDMVVESESPVLSVDEGNEELFIVEDVESDLEDSFEKGRNHFISVGERFLKVTNVTSTKVEDQLDLQCLTKVELLNGNILSLNFHHERRDRRLRVYRMSSSDEAEKLKKILQTAYEQNQLKMTVSSKLHCLRCYAIFSKKEAVQSENTSFYTTLDKAQTCLCPHCLSPYHTEKEPSQLSTTSDNVPKIYLKKNLKDRSTTSFLGKDTVSMPSLDIQESDSVLDSHVHDEDLGSDLPLSPSSEESLPILTKAIKTQTSLSQYPYLDANNPSYVHSSLKLYLECEILESGEVLQLISQVSVVERRDELPEAVIETVIILTNLRMLLCNVSQETMLDPASSLSVSVHHSLALETLVFVLIGLGSQYALLEFVDRTCLILFQDSNLCKAFMERLPVTVSNLHNSRLHGMKFDDIGAACLWHNVINMKSYSVKRYVGLHVYDILSTHNKQAVLTGEELHAWIRDHVSEEENFCTDLLKCGALVQENHQSSSVFEMKHKYSFTVDLLEVGINLFEKTLDEVFQMCQLVGQCEPPEPVAILIFKDEIFVIKFNFFDWPLKRNLPLALYSVEKLPFEQIQRRSITDVQSASVSDKQPLLQLKFFDEEDHSPWLLSFTTSSSCDFFARKLNNLWKASFGIELTFSIFSHV